MTQGASALAKGRTEVIDDAGALVHSLPPYSRDLTIILAAFASISGSELPPRAGFVLLEWQE